jgi:hypothetical protein
MRRLIAAIILIATCININAQENTNSRKENLSGMNIPTVTRDFEKFDFANYDSASGYKQIELPDGTIQEAQKQSYGFIVRIQPPNSYFTLIKKFYANGNIKAKGLIFNSGDFRYGVWYYFDEQGKLTKEEDNDAAYNFSFNKLYDYLMQRHISFTPGQLQGGYNNSITKKTDAGGPKWIVEWLKDSSKMPNTLEVLTIDGITGKVLHTEDMSYFNN